MRPEIKKKAENRVRRVVGQVGGIQRMIEEDRYCVDVLLQIAAARAALDQLGKLVLGSHIETCVADALASRQRAERETKVAELLEVFSRFGLVEHH
jgi:CsoR family transcriptional regulator, copper-sensing transcriptional repressor